MYILIAILAFGILIADHELGHFLVAKACGIKVNEFAIGMGPALLKRQGKETLYTLRLLPIGGYCAMEGEDEDTGDARAFTRQAPWKRVLVLLAGASMNFLLGLLILLVLYAGAQGFASNRVESLVEGFRYADNGLQAGDEILEIDGHRIYYMSDFSTYMSRAGDTVEMTVRRDGQKLTLHRYGLRPELYEEDGESVLRYGLAFSVAEGTPLERVKYACYSAWNFVRLVWMSLGDLVTGRANVRQVSGVVGIVHTIGEVGEQSATVGIALQNIAYLVAFIAVNLAVMNLLPLPALDGGRIFLLLVTELIALVAGRRPDPKYEAYIHAAGMVLLLGLMAFVLFNDISTIIRG